MKKYLKILLPCLGAVPLFFVLSLAVMVVVLTRQIPVYVSKAIVELPPPPPNATYESNKIVMATEVRKLTAGRTMTLTREKINRPAAYIASHLQRVTARPIKGTVLLEMSVASTDPVLSAEFANAWAAVAVDEIKPNPSGGPRIVQLATPAAAPTTPRKVQSIFFAGLGGVTFGAIAAVLLATALYSKSMMRGGEQPG